MKPSIRDQLLNAGLKGSEPIEEPREEFIQGEIRGTLVAMIADGRKSIYGKPIKRGKFRPRHGRVVIMNIKEQMDKKHIKRDSFQFRVIQYLLDTTTQWSSAKAVAVALKWKANSASATLVNLRQVGILYFEGVQGEKGWVYKLKEQYYKMSAEEIYLNFLERFNHIRKERGKKKEEKPPKQKRPSARPIIDALTKEIEKVLGVKVEVSGNINITFKLG